MNDPKQENCVLTQAQSPAREKKSRGYPRMFPAFPCKKIMMANKGGYEKPGIKQNSKVTTQAAFLKKTKQAGILPDLHFLFLIG